MYQVIEMYGDNEPWWFFEHWQEDIKQTTSFDRLEEAKTFFSTQYERLEKKYLQKKEKEVFLVAFWTPGEVRFCEECDEDLQQYYGLMLLKDGQKINDSGQLKKVKEKNMDHCCRLHIDN